jgi:hypothetical protein
MFYDWEVCTNVGGICYGVFQGKSLDSSESYCFVILICNCVSEQFFFLNSHSGGWSPNRVHSARRPLNGLLYLPWVIMMIENLVK